MVKPWELASVLGLAIASARELGQCGIQRLALSGCLGQTSAAFVGKPEDPHLCPRASLLRGLSWPLLLSQPNSLDLLYNLTGRSLFQLLEVLQLTAHTCIFSEACPWSPLEATWPKVAWELHAPLEVCDQRQPSSFPPGGTKSGVSSLWHQAEADLS